MIALGIPLVLVISSEILTYLCPDAFGGIFFSKKKNNKIYEEEMLNSI